jgi:hypothetical protein
MIVIAGLWLATPAMARLGENQVQHEQRYGRADEDKAGVTVTVQPNCIKTYRFQGWRLVVTFRNTFAVRKEYWKTSPSDQDIAAILVAEAGGGRWVKQPYNKWVNSNGRVLYRETLRVIVLIAEEAEREATVEAERRKSKSPPAF